MINLGINNKCNQDCSFCQTQKFLKEGIWNEPSSDEVAQKIRSAARDSDHILFSGGGEATTLPNLPELIRYARSLGIKKVSLETNGVALGDLNYVKELEQCGLTECKVSLHSHIEQVSDEITRALGTFKETIRGMHNLAGSSIQFTTVQHTITSLNYRTLRDFALFLNQDFPSVTCLCLNFIRPIKGDPVSEGITPRLRDVGPHLIDLFRYAKESNFLVCTASTLGFPYCFLPGFEHFSLELEQHALNSRQAILAPAVYDKVKGLQCACCSFTSYCSGISTSYASIYGTEELKPLLVSPMQALERIRNQKG